MTLKKDCGITGLATFSSYWATLSDGEFGLALPSTVLVNLYPSHYEGFWFARFWRNGLWSLWSLHASVSKQYVHARKVGDAGSLLPPDDFGGGFTL